MPAAPVEDDRVATEMAVPLGPARKDITLSFTLFRGYYLPCFLKIAQDLADRVGTRPQAGLRFTHYPSYADYVYHMEKEVRRELTAG